MGVPVVTKASGGIPVIDVTATTPGLGMPVTEASNGYGIAVTKVSVAIGGLPVTFVSATGGAISLSDTDWPSAANRPTLNGSILSWVGPSGGGANNGNPVAQQRTLTASGDITSNAAGQIIEGRLVSGSIRINHNNVTIRQCAALADELFIVATNNAPTGLVVEDCALGGIERRQNRLFARGQWLHHSPLQHLSLFRFRGSDRRKQYDDPRQLDTRPWQTGAERG